MLAPQSEANVCRHKCNLKKSRLLTAQDTQIRGCVLVPRTQKSLLVVETPFFLYPPGTVKVAEFVSDFFFKECVVTRAIMGAKRKNQSSSCHFLRETKE